MGFCSLIFPAGRNKSPFLSDEFTGLVETLHKSVCDVIPVSSNDACVH